jgi:hypothetical protein
MNSETAQFFKMAEKLFGKYKFGFKAVGFVFTGASFVLYNRSLIQKNGKIFIKN